MPDSLLIKTDSNIAEIEINRPDCANAIDEELWFAIGNCFSELDKSKTFYTTGLGMDQKLLVCALARCVCFSRPFCEEVRYCPQTSKDTHGII